MLKSELEEKLKQLQVDYDELKEKYTELDRDYEAFQFEESYMNVEAIEKFSDYLRQELSEEDYEKVKALLEQFIIYRTNCDQYIRTYIHDWYK